MASVITAGTTSTTALNLTGDTSGELQINTNNGATTVMNLTANGNINIPTAGARITGDFSNATLANRVMFQTSTTNSNSILSVIPNGTATTSAFQAFNNSDPTNASQADLRVAGSTDVRLSSTVAGSGTALPLTMYTGGSERLRIDTSGNVGIGTNNPGVCLDVSGTIRSTSATIADAATITPTAGTTNQYTVTALAQAATIAAPSGTPIDGQKLTIRLKDNGVARALTWTTSSGAYRAVGVTLPTTTSAGKVTYVGCIYNSQDTFWDVIAVTTQA